MGKSGNVVPCKYVSASSMDPNFIGKVICFLQIFLPTQSIRPLVRRVFCQCEKFSLFPSIWADIWKYSVMKMIKRPFLNVPTLKNKNSAEGVIAPAGAKVTGASIRMWLLNKFISFLAVLTWKTGLKKNVDKVPSGAHIFQASPIPSNGYIFSTDFSYIQPNDNGKLT